MHSPEYILTAEWTKKVKSCKAILFDVDDTLVRRIPESLRVKLAMFLSWFREGNVNAQTAYIRELTDPRWLDAQYRTSSDEALQKRVDPMINLLLQTFIGASDDYTQREQIIAGLGFSSQEFWRYYRQFSEATEPNIPLERLVQPEQGIQDLMIAIRARSLKTGIVSNSHLERILDRLQILGNTSGVFDCIVSTPKLSDELGRDVKKPNPFGIQHAAELLGIAVEDDLPVVYVGNAPHDITAAHGAKVRVPTFLGARSPYSTTDNVLSINALRELTNLFTTET